MDEIKVLMKAKIMLALSGITQVSPHAADRDASETVLTLAKAYEIINNIKEEK